MQTLICCGCVESVLRFDVFKLADLFFNLGTDACLVECCLLAGEEFALLMVPLVLQERITATTSRLWERKFGLWRRWWWWWEDDFRIPSCRWCRGRESQILMLRPGLVHHAAAWHLRADDTIVAIGRWKATCACTCHSGWAAFLVHERACRCEWNTRWEAHGSTIFQPFQTFWENQHYMLSRIFIIFSRKRM